MIDSMLNLSLAPLLQFSTVRFVLTDMDETLTYRGRLHADTYTALERLQTHGICVVPVTAAPAGWCDQMARMWPVDGVIAENGGLFLRRSPDGHRVERHYWHPSEGFADVRKRLHVISKIVERAVPQARPADDQVFRLTSLAYSRTGTEVDDRIVDALIGAGADATINNLWVLGWIGGYDKLSMSLRVLAETFEIDAAAATQLVAYSGDSTNDAPMFRFFKHTVGVSTVVDYLPQLPVPPQWITNSPGGAGFVEFADAILKSRSNEAHEMPSESVIHPFSSAKRTSREQR
ncbi:HAD-superfamily hydrolase [Cupriavidus basilensis OR16]|uniref:HAD-superfamily hydrolase n=2 Tax=Cupriavidus basilensis TaxID=68895 RepID=H1S422_9BURK|nr:HAD-superfamily hydrolase [Cupriavidus basilensis OR16]